MNLSTRIRDTNDRDYYIALNKQEMVIESLRGELKLALHRIHKLENQVDTLLTQREVTKNG